MPQNLYVKLIGLKITETKIRIELLKIFDLDTEDSLSK